MESLGYVCPVSTVSVIQLIKGQGILNDLWVECVICVCWGGVTAVFMRSFLYSVAARMHFLSSRRFIFLAAV